MIISLISQKGGVGKSTLARLLATEFTKAGWDVKIADLDPAQGTSTKWSIRRDSFNVDPEIKAEKYRDVHRAIKDSEKYDLMILDGPAHAGKDAAIMARASDIILLPTGYSIDDLDPQVQVAYDIEVSGVPLDKVRIVFSRARGSASEDRSARDFVSKAKLSALAGVIRELPSIRQAHAAGKSAGETGFRSVDAEAASLMSEIGDIIRGDD